jgi:hypothetical protein
MADFYSRMLKLKKQEAALRCGENGGEMFVIPNGKEDFVFSFIRKKENSKVLFVLNLSNKKQKVKLDSPDIVGSAQEIFGAQSEAAFKNQIQLTLEPWQYFVYTYKK